MALQNTIKPASGTGPAFTVDPKTGAEVPQTVAPDNGAPPSTTEILSGLNFDPTKGPVSTFDKDSNIIGPDGKVILSHDQLYDGTVSDYFLQKIAANPYVSKAMAIAGAPFNGTNEAILHGITGHGDQIPGDTAYALSGGTVGNNHGPTTGIITPNTVKEAGDAVRALPGQAETEAEKAAKAAKAAAKALGLGGGDSSSIDTWAAQSDHDRAVALAG